MVLQRRRGLPGLANPGIGQPGSAAISCSASPRPCAGAVGMGWEGDAEAPQASHRQRERHERLTGAGAFAGDQTRGREHELAVDRDRGRVRRARGERRTGVVGQRLGLSVGCLARCLHGTRDHAQADPAPPASDEREDRTVPPHARRRLGLRPLLHVRDRTPGRAARMAALLESPLDPLRDRSPTRQQDQQPLWTSQLDLLRHASADGMPAIEVAGKAVGVRICPSQGSRGQRRAGGAAQSRSSAHQIPRAPPRPRRCA